MKHAISEILDKINKAETREEKLFLLQKENNNPGLKILLKMTYDPHLVWELPEGSPPYRPCTFPEQDGMLYSEIKRLYLFHRGGNPNLSQLRREQLFVQILESITPSDAVLLLGVKDKKLPYKEIDKKLVNEAFPGLLVY